ncbi:beta galactosidase jelly roll domain-containing protein [Halobacteria archaeon AArc-curdl1]|uniref:Beta galactosidase jelly roll domain-containing protein n=1 Tax=Natronosalvus hydrolyticus TaxID=2979988 RepID=A0AAP3E5R9_9EURY|nr:beta galactosidase jelly roll domain-containing protein [Halobacteria archaeon AArc-curdl1]
MTTEPNPDDHSDDRAPLRYERSLNGSWEFLTDPERSGRSRGWDEPDAVWPARAHTVTVPRVWQEDDAYRSYTGTAWYRRSFDLENVPEETHAFLRFDAVDYETTVWLNGERVGENRGGYLPFEFDITDSLNAGENHIIVCVTDPEDLSEIPHGKQGDPWYTRISGIWQSVTLAFRPETRIVDVRVTPDLENDQAKVAFEIVPGPADPNVVSATLEARLDGAVDAQMTVPVTASDANRGDDGDSDAETHTDAYADESTIEMSAVLCFDDPVYWSPDNPTLYDISVTLERNNSVVDRYNDTFGMRSFETRNGEFLLNGDPITIRGVLEQGYYPETFYRPHDENAFTAEIDLASDLGFNLIRKHVKPAHPDFLEAADRMGMLVWQEPANPTRYTDRSRTEVRGQLEALIDRDYNRPSVVVWSLYNEEWGIGHHDIEETLWTDVEKQRFLAECYEWVQSVDPTRVICDNSGWAHVATDINDYHRYYVSPDQASQWAADVTHICHNPGDNYATVEFDEPDAPIVISELGTWGLPDVDDLREHYGGDPHWFDHEFLVEALKRPDGIDDRFQRTTLPDVFDDYTDLSAAWQRREFTSIKHLIEELRIRESMGGYVLTELSDTEWEFNGLVTAYRESKSFLSAFSAVNDELAVVLRPESHVAWVGGEKHLELYVVNDGRRTVTGTLEWTFAERTATKAVSVPANGATSVSTTIPVAMAVSESDTLSESTEPVVQTVDLVATFVPDNSNTTDGIPTVSTSEPITVVDASRKQTPEATVYAEGLFASRLAEAGVPVTHSLSGNVDVAVTSDITTRIEDFATSGGAVIQVPNRDGEMHATGPFSYRLLPQPANWNTAAGFYYQDSPLLADICDDRTLGWELEGCYPHVVGAELNPSVDRVHVGYVEGWIANWGSPLVIRGYGKGSMTALTFRLAHQYGRHPVGTLLCDRLLRWLSDRQ